MIADCDRDPSERVTVNENGVHVVYAVCPQHAVEIRNGGMFVQPPNESRGILGLEQK